MPKARILIAGDSWGCGEWNASTKVEKLVRHSGIEQYFVDDGFEVINVSSGGATLDIIINQIIKFNPKDFDYIFVFVTDSSRTVTKQFNDFSKFWENINSIYDIKARDKKILNDFYNKLNCLNTKIYLLGGLTHINETELTRYPNLESPILSIMRLLTNDKMLLPELSFSGAAEHMPRKMSIDVQRWTLKQVKAWDEIRQTKHFKLDLAHPDRHGHFKIFNHLKDCVIDK